MDEIKHALANIQVGIVPSPPTAEEDAQAEVLPATFSNRFQIAAGPFITRIAFGETVLTKTTYHGAVSIPTADAENLARVLLELIQKNKEMLATLEKKDGDHH